MLYLFSNNDNGQPENGNSEKSAPTTQSSSEDDGYANLTNNESSIEEQSASAGDGDAGDESENDNNSSLSGSTSVWTIQSPPLIEISEVYDDTSGMNDEKIYEDLCYVTFSPNSREVHIYS